MEAYSLGAVAAGGPQDQIDRATPLIRARFVIVVASFIVLCALSPIVTSVALLTLAVFALRGGPTAIRALSLLLLASYLNPGVFQPSAQVSWIRWIVIASALLGGLVRTMLRGGGLPRPVVALVAFGCLQIVIAIVASVNPAVSIAKLAAFVAGTTAIFLCFSRASPKSIVETRQWFFSLLLVVLVSSTPLLWLDAGYLRNGSGFQGILNHPQAFGIFLAPFIAWLAPAPRSPHRTSWTPYILLVMSLVGLLASKTRTAAAALAVGLLLTILAALLTGSPWRAAFLSRVYRQRLPLLCASGFAVVWLTVGDGLSVVYNWTTKERPTATLVEAVTYSRMPQIRASLENFEANPWFGVGFGTPSDQVAGNQFLQEVGGIPTALPIEKVFLPTGVLEETGIVGAIALLGLLVGVFLPFLRHADVPTAWLVWTALAINVGEVVLFSLGGIGLLMWLLAGYGYAESMIAARAHEQ